MRLIESWRDLGAATGVTLFFLVWLLIVTVVVKAAWNYLFN